MKTITITIAPEEPYYPKDPGDYPHEKPDNEKPDPVIPPMEPDPEPYEPDTDPDSIIPEEPEEKISFIPAFFDIFLTFI